MRAKALVMIVVGTVLASTSGYAGDNDRAGDTPRVYVTIDKSEVVDFSAPPTKVSVTNTAIADIVVVSPTRILINGKGMGETSLLVFYGTKVQGFDLVVHPAPLVFAPVAARPVRGASRGGASGRAIFTSALRPRCRGGVGASRQRQARE